MQSDDSLANLKDNHKFRQQQQLLSPNNVSSSSSSPSLIGSHQQHRQQPQLHSGSNNKVIGDSPLTPVSELTARLKGPFALRDDSSDVDDDVEKLLQQRADDRGRIGVDDGDDDKENSNDVTTTTAMVAFQGHKLETTGREYKKSKIGSALDYDLTPTASTKDAPYVSEAELDALLDNFDADTGEDASRCVIGRVEDEEFLVELSCSSRQYVPEVTDDDLDGLTASVSDNGTDGTPFTTSDNGTDGLLDSGNSSGGEVSSLLDSIDDIPSASVEIPSISDSTFSEDIPNLQQLPVDDFTVGGDVLGGNGNQSQHQLCPSGGARPKVRPGSLGVTSSIPGAISESTGSSNITSNQNDDDALDDDVDSNVDEEGEIVSSASCFGPPDDMTPTNHLPSSPCFDNHLQSRSRFSDDNDPTITTTNEETLISGTKTNIDSIARHVISSSSSSSTTTTSSLTTTTISFLSSTATSSTSFSTAPSRLTSSSSLSSFTPQSYPSISSSDCVVSSTNHLVSSSSLQNRNQYSHDTAVTNEITASNDADLTVTPAITSSSLVSCSSSTLHENISQNSADNQPSSSSKSLLSFSRSPTSLIASTNEEAMTPDTPDTDEDLDQSSSSIRHVTSPPTPFVKGLVGGLLEGENDADPNDTLPTPTSFEPLETDEVDAGLVAGTIGLEATSSVDRVIEPEDVSMRDEEEKREADSSSSDKQNSNTDLSFTSYSTSQREKEDDDDADETTTTDGQKEPQPETTYLSERVSSVQGSAAAQMEQMDAMFSNAIDDNCSSASQAMDLSSSSSSFCSSSDSVRQLEPSRPSAKRPSSLDLPSRSPFAFKPQKRHHKGVDDTSPSLDSVCVLARAGLCVICADVLYIDVCSGRGLRVNLGTRVSDSGFDLGG